MRPVSIKPVQNAATPGDHKKVANTLKTRSYKQKVYKKKELLQHYQEFSMAGAHRICRHIRCYQIMKKS